MDSHWLPTLFQTCPGGVSSAVSPDLLPPGQFAWGFNVAVRGAKPRTRPPFIERPVGLPRGLIQGASYFGVQGGMIIVAIAGRLYRVRIGVNTYSSEPIPLSWYNSGILRQSWFQQTIETLVVQDGQSDAILYDGSVARRAGPTEVPRGRMMAYGNGRLWVAVNENELLAGDIRTGQPGSELFFTEGTYLVGGGKLFFPRGITGMDFIPVTGAADFGTLIIGGKDYLESIRADVTTRDQWGMPGFITNVFRDVGFAGDWSIVQVNQDLYWRDADGGIRSLANNISTNSMPGSTPISREVGRLVDFDSNQLLPFCSAIYFDNRLLMTSSPYLNVSGGVGFKDIVALDFSPISTMQGKAPPAYDGQWTGISGITQLITGEFDGKERAFALASDQAGINRLWEISKQRSGGGGGGSSGDLFLSCDSGAVTDGSSSISTEASPIQSFIEYPAADFRLPTQRKRLERCDVWLSGIIGVLELVAYWRSDNNQTWTEWDRAEARAKTEDDSTVAPHVWKNLLPQQRTQIKTFTIPDGIDEITKYALQMGFAFQIRLAWRGKCQIDKMMIYASPQDDPDYANRETLTTEFIENNVTGNGISYSIPDCTDCVAVTGDAITDGTWAPSGFVGGPFAETTTFHLQNTGAEAMEWSVAVSETWMIVDVPSGTLLPGQEIDVTVSLDADDLPAQIDPYTGTISFTNISHGCVSPAGAREVAVSLTVEGSMIFEARQLGDGSSSVSMCGFGEYVPSTPPRYYKTKDRTGENFLVCEMGEYADCVVPTPICPGHLGFSFTGFVSGIPYEISGGGALAPLSDSPTHRTFVVSVGGTVQDQEPPLPPTAMPCRMLWDQSGAEHFAIDGDTLVIPKVGGDMSIAFQFDYVSWQSWPGGGSCIDPGLYLVAVYNDTWAQHQTHSGPNCTFDESDLSQRESGLNFECGDPFSGGTVGPLPASDPASVYGGTHLVINNVTPISRTYTGIGCTGASPNLVKYDGVIGETLGAEDTQQDAIDRFAAANPFGPYASATQVNAGYQTRTGVSFGYERGQWRASVSGLTPSHDYTFTLDIYRRTFGTGSYALIGTVSLPFTTDGAGGYTFGDQEVSNPEGYQTYLTNPTVT